MFGGENTMQHLPTVTNPYFLDGTSVLMYDVASNQMSMINAATPQNTTRVQHTATLTADGSKIYVLGGFTQPAFSNFSPNVTVQTDLNIWSYDTTSTQWQAVTPQLDSPGLGLARATHTTTLLPNTTRMLIFGGYLNSMYQCNMPPSLHR
ncbi:hypothetical protein DM01DRAFT_1130911 [Hesseltinella vesiculosa]|uniref:Attractin/MKLN-like beta-propeller domain-containing protein n=1 Tax=Hesseltinella vesiculosa TaxID=101127 RepID=A0A1X2G944_9FUNG|nr:hypothetical protein DM01DRAFT_1130911 [Hesseltinella vesiculosa]